jgi:hypothetical protein
MSIPESFEEVSRFLKENDDLVKEIRDAAAGAKDKLQSLADRVEANRNATTKLVKGMGAFPFAVANRQDTKDRQKKLLLQIEIAQRKIQKYRDDPTMLGLLQSDLSVYYLELGNTYLEEPVERMVAFSREEAVEISGLLQSATLDAEKRQDLAAILDAAVQVSKAVLKVAVKLTV